MLLDRRHTPWIAATAALGVAAIGLYVWLDRRTPGGIRGGGDTVGLWYGVAGSALMVFAGLLAALRRVPSWWWIGSRQVWLRGHIWLGLLSVVVIACHARLRLGGAIEKALWLVLAAVIVSGIFGLILQQFLPRWLLQRFPDEAPYEQIPNLCRTLRHRAAAIVAELAPEPGSEGSFPAELREFHAAQVRPFLTVPVHRGVWLRDELRGATVFDALRKRHGFTGASSGPAGGLESLELICRERRQLLEQERLHHWLHGWLLLHIPLSVALLVLGVAHAVMSLYYGP